MLPQRTPQIEAETVLGHKNRIHCITNICEKKVFIYKKG